MIYIGKGKMWNGMMWKYIINKYCMSEQGKYMSRSKGRQSQSWLVAEDPVNFLWYLLCQLGLGLRLGLGELATVLFVQRCDLWLTGWNFCISQVLVSLWWTPDFGHCVGCSCPTQHFRATFWIFELAKQLVTKDQQLISAKTTRPVTCDSQIDWNSTV